MAAKPKSRANSRHGGRRPGAGRKTKAANALRSDFNATARDLIVAKLPKLIENLFTLADGGDRAANEYLMNRVLGKPTERQEVSGKDGGPIEVDNKAMAAAAAELEQWRKQMTESLSSLPSAPPTRGTSSTPTG